MVEKTTEQRLQEAEYRIKILTELLYRVVDRGDAVLDFYSNKALQYMREEYGIDTVYNNMNHYNGDYRFFHKLGDTNE